MFRKFFGKLFMPAVLIAVLVAPPWAASAGAFSVDVKNFYFSDYTDSPGPRVINNYNFSSGEILDNAVVIPAGFVIRPAAEATTYRLAPIPDPKKTIAVSLTTGSQKATLQTATEGGVVLDTLPTQMGPTPPYVLPAINQWVMEVSLTNFAGMVDPAKAYRTQIGMGSMVDGPHPEFTATWIGGNLELQAEIYDGGGGSVVWPVPPQVFKEVKTGLTPAATLLTLRIVCNASGREGKMDFEYRLGGVEAQWYGLATYDIPAGSAFMSFPSYFPYIDMREEGGSTVTVSGTVRDWNNAVISNPGVTVSLVGGSQTTTSSTTDGSFSLAGVPANTPVSLKFSRAGYLEVYTADIGGWAADVTITNDAYGGSAPVNMPTTSDLSAFGAQPDSNKALILGRVADQTYRYSSHIGGAAVTAQGLSKPYPVKYRNPFGVLEDTPSTWGNGRYYVLNVDGNDTVTVTATKAGWSFPSRTFRTQGNAVSQGRIFGTAPGYDASLSGFVKTLSGAPISGATVALNGDPNKSTTSNQDGSYTFSGLPQDAFFYAKVTAAGYVPAYAGPVNLQGSVSGIDILLATAGEMTTYGVTGSNGLIGCTVRDPSSMNPLSGARVEVTSRSGTNYTDTVLYDGGGSTTSTTGKFLIPNILPGDVVKIDVSKAGYTFYSTYMDGFTGSVTERNIFGTATGADEQAIRDGFASAVGYINNTSLTNQERLDGFMAFVSAGYLNNGQTRTDFQANVQGLINAGGHLAYALGTITIQGETATVPVTWTITLPTGQEVDQETLIFRKEGTSWLIYGNQARHYVSVTSQRWASGYHASFYVDDHPGITTIAVTGTGISGTINLIHTEGQGWWYNQPVVLGTTIPTTTPTYQITVYEGAQSYNYNRQITGYVTDFATNLSPTGQAGGPVIFTWTGIPGAAKYAVELSEINWNRLWNKYDIPPTRTWAGYDGDPLVTGKDYRYSIIAKDANGNASFAEGQFTYNGPAGISFTGQVTTAAGAALLGVSVTIDGNPYSTPSALTDGSGNFTLPGVPAGSWFALKMAKDGYRPTYTALLRSQANFGGGPAFALLTPAETESWGVQFDTKGVIATRVVDAAGNNIAGAVVTAQSRLHPGVPYTVTYRDDAGNFGGSSTYSNGRFFVLNVDEGDIVTVTATKSGYGPQSRSYLTHAGGISQGRIVITMPTHANVSGTVVYSGSKTGNIKLRLWSADLMNEASFDQTLAEPGAFSFAGVPNGRYYLGAFRDSDGNNNYTAGEAYGYYQNTAGLLLITLSGVDVSGVNFALADPAAGPTGASAAITSNLAAAEPVYLIFFRQGESLATYSEPIFVKEVTLAPGVSNIQADFVDKLYDGVPVPAGTYDFYLVTGDLSKGPVKGVVQNRQTGVVISRGAITALAPVTFNTGATVSARVTSTFSGSPLLNTNVRLGTMSNPAEPSTFVGFAWGRTDANGDILFEHVPVGSYFLVLMRDGYTFTPIAVSVTSNGQTIAIPEANTRMTPTQTPATISGTLAPFGAAVDNRVLLKIDDTVVAQAKPSEAAGAYTITDVVPGTYTLVGSARGQAPQQVNVTVSAGQTLTQNFTLSSTKNVVVSGLEWLLVHQRADGSFDDNLTGDAHQYVFGWTGYTALTLTAIYENPKYSNSASPDFIGDNLKNQIRDALYGVAGTKNGIKQYFLGTYRSEDDPDTAWSDIGAFYNSTIKWMPSASTPVALEKLIALGLPLNDPKVLGSVQFLLNAQITAAKAIAPIYAGGWRYNPSNTDTDNWETAWVVMALMKAGVNPSVQAVIDGVNHIKRSQVTGTSWDAGLFRYQPGRDGAPLGTSAASVLALNFAGESRNSEYVERFFQWAKNNGGFSGVTRYADAYWWSMFPWAAILYADPDHSGKTMYDTLTLTWNMADHIIGLQQQDGRWVNNNFSPGGSNSGNSVMYTASALMAIAPYAGLAPRPNETTVSGLVQNPSGGAVQSAKVEALLDGVARASAVTNTSGAYTLNVPQNYAYEIRVTANGYVRKSIATANVGTGGLTGQNIAYAEGDVDAVAPTITQVTPPSGQETQIAYQSVSATLADAKSGIDPSSIVFKLDGVTVAAQYNAQTGQVTHTPFPWLRPGVHNATIDVKDYAGNSALQAAWWFRVISRLKGDVNNDAKVDLADAILVIQVLSGKNPAGIRADYAASGADVNGDGRIGLAEVQFSQQRVAALRTCESGVGVTISSGADGHPPAWFSFSGGRVDGSDSDFAITNAAGDQPPYSAYGWVNSGYGIIDLGAVGIGGVTQVPESGYTIPQSLNLTPGRSYAFRLNDGTYAAMEVKSVTPISPMGVTMVFDYKYQPSGTRFF
jgi:hypothetical protein